MINVNAWEGKTQRFEHIDHLVLAGMRFAIAAVELWRVIQVGCADDAHTLPWKGEHRAPISGMQQCGCQAGGRELVTRQD